MARWMMLLIAAVAIVYCATVLNIGDAVYIIPGAILLGIILFYAVAERGMTALNMRRHHGSRDAAAADDTDWPIPSAHVTPDDATPTGDTPEVHNELSPHDLPPDHPGREAAEEQAGRGGTTTGNEQGGAGGRFRRGDDRTEQRTGERQRSAAKAKSTGGSGGLPGHDEESHDGGVSDRPGQEFPL
jgi:hypothetical protein